MVKEMSPLFVSFDILANSAEMLKKTCLLYKFVTGGPFLMHHPVYIPPHSQSKTVELAILAFLLFERALGLNLN